jgi:hypothetical protein
MDSLDSKIINKLYLDAIEEGEHNKYLTLAQEISRPQKVYRSIRYICRKCDKTFINPNLFYKHLVQKQVPCDRNIDIETYVRRHLDILARKYQELREYAKSDLTDAIRLKIVKSVYNKATMMLRILESHPYLVDDGIVESDIAESIKIILQNIGTGDYDNMVLNNE